MIGVAEIRVELTARVRALEPDAVPLPEVVSLWDDFDAIERQAAAAKTLLARRLEESRTWQRAGHRSAAEFIAKRSGSSVGAARTQLELSRKVEERPTIEKRLRDGRLSAAQAALVVEGTSVNPDAEAHLLEQAERGSLKELRDEVLRARAAADADREATHRRIHAARRLRTWTDAEGAWNLAARGTVADGARIEAALAPLLDTQFHLARTEDRREERQAYAFDALVTLAKSGADAGGNRPNLRHLALLRVDVDVLRRGEVAGDDEMCEITGIGPVPASTARDLLGESILKLVITKGVDVLNVTHLGRGPTAAQKIALLWASPTCTVEGCAHAAREIDHREPFAQNPRTRLENLDRLCGHHHDLKTYDGWALVEGAGKRPMVPPDDPRHPKNRPKRDTGRRSQPSSTGSSEAGARYRSGSM